MFLEGNMAAPPTITVFSPDISLFIIFLSSALAGAMTPAVMASAPNATAERSAIRLDMDRLPMDGDSPQEPARHEVATTVRRSLEAGCVAVGPSYGRGLGRFRNKTYCVG